MELREYFRVIFKSWWIIIPLTFIALTVSLIFSYSRTPIYEATATYITRLSTPSNTDVNTTVFAMDTLQGRQGIAISYCQVITGVRTREDAFRLAGLEPTPELLEKYPVQCTNLPETNVLRVAVQGPSPSLVESYSRAIGIVGTADINNRFSVFPLDQLDPVILAEDPVSPKYFQTAVLGSALGLVIGVAVSFLLEYLRSPLERLEASTIRNMQLGTYNERYFRERFEQEIDRAHARNRPITMAIVRLRPTEDFEIYPEVTQFKLLRAAANLMQNAVHQRNLVASLGPRTFGVLLAETSGDEALEVFRHLHEDFRANSFEAEGYITNFEVTSGLVTSSGGEIGYKSMLDKTFVALDVADEKDDRIYLVRATPRPFGPESGASSASLPFGNIDIPGMEEEASRGAASVWTTGERGSRSGQGQVSTGSGQKQQGEASGWRDSDVGSSGGSQASGSQGTGDDQDFILGKIFNSITENLVSQDDDESSGGKD
ncbi:MAG TPA: Wzz/FepE/Etk N-terminal domain-containing protein [Aggregatilineales bacterium]|nr:Wzz/FepE/Etk N-terminal domain-containing protein [Aggregatilineales bacterium]